MGNNPCRRLQPRRQFGHRDVWPRLHPANQHLHMGRQFTASGRPALSRRCCRTRQRDTLRQLHGKARAHPKAPGSITPRVTRSYIPLHAIAQIPRIRFPHDPPPNPVNHNSDLLGIPRFLFLARCSSWSIPLQALSIGTSRSRHRAFTSCSNTRRAGQNRGRAMDRLIAAPPGREGGREDTPSPPFSPQAASFLST